MRKQKGNKFGNDTNILLSFTDTDLWVQNWVYSMLPFAEEKVAESWV